MTIRGGRRAVDYKHYGQQKKRPDRKGGRLWLLLILVCLCVVALWWFWPQSEQLKVAPPVAALPSLPAEPIRKKIYDRNLQTIALSFPVYAVYVKPLELDDANLAAEQIADVMGLDSTALKNRLRSQRTYVWLGRRVPADQARKLLALDVDGVYLRKSTIRFYPHYNAAAQVVGYVQDNHGLSGVELYYDQELLGQEAQFVQGHDGQTNLPGKHVVLSLDLHVQTLLEKQMALLAAQTKAASVAALAVNPATGAILAYAQHPTFDPNAFWQADSRNQQVKAVATPLQPGAISGLFRYGAALYAQKDLHVPLQENAEHLIVPRIMKKGSTSRGGHWWLWPKGGYLSDELSELPDPTISDDELLAFQKALGISCADAVDLPEKVDELRDSALCGQGSLNGISLLTGFSRLVNGGDPVQLHLKRGSLDDDGNFEPMVYRAKGLPLPEMSGKMVAALTESAGSKAKFLAVEYLAPLVKDEMIVTENLAQETDGSEQFDGVLLAAGPGVEPELALLIAVENGQFERRDASPMRRWAGRFFNELRKSDFQIAMDALPALLPATSEKMYQRWLREFEADSVEKQQKNVSGKATMPDLVGKSLRKALGVLQPLFVEVDIRGAGQVVEQLPASGVEISGARVVITLGPNPQT